METYKKDEATIYLVRGKELRIVQMSDTRFLIEILTKKKAVKKNTEEVEQKIIFLGKSVFFCI